MSNETKFSHRAEKGQFSAILASSREKTYPSERPSEKRSTKKRPEKTNFDIWNSRQSFRALKKKWIKNHNTILTKLLFSTRCEPLYSLTFRDSTASSSAMFKIKTLLQTSWNALPSTAYLLASHRRPPSFPRISHPFSGPRQVTLSFDRESPWPPSRPTTWTRCASVCFFTLCDVFVHIFVTHL